MMRRVFAGLLLIALGAAPTLSAQQGTTLDSALAVALRPTLEAARTDGLPEKPLLAKAREGVLKRAPRERIVGAVAALADRMRAARAELAPNATEHEVIAGAEALAVGVSGQVLRTIRVHRPRGTAAMPLEVMAHMAWRGVPPDQAADAITRAVTGGATAAQLIALDASVRQDVESGVAPPVALQQRTRGLTFQLQSPVGRSAADAAPQSMSSSGATRARPRKP
ncbi:MAG TPA: hypothetical protein VJ717_13140 [Gemmatimonadaceae bacterium]|nr:hypothetical protein [Gemmatimonadaceae bacterium]